MKRGTGRLAHLQLTAFESLAKSGRASEFTECNRSCFKRRHTPRPYQHVPLNSRIRQAIETQILRAASDKFPGRGHGHAGIIRRNAEKRAIGNILGDFCDFNDFGALRHVYRSFSGYDPKLGVLMVRSFEIADTRY
ncbi:hypothetical protein MnTg02_02250 [bacterium MnTg02]|nr:hypothetical protein MnTg02_02250 [bacterium MnTg02]